MRDQSTGYAFQAYEDSFHSKDGTRGAEFPSASQEYTRWGADSPGDDRRDSNPSHQFLKGESVIPRRRRIHARTADVSAWGGYRRAIGRYIGGAPINCAPTGFPGMSECTTWLVLFDSFRLGSRFCALRRWLERRLPVRGPSLRSG